MGGVDAADGVIEGEGNEADTYDACVSTKRGKVTREGEWGIGARDCEREWGGVGSLCGNVFMTVDCEPIGKGAAREVVGSGEGGLDGEIVATGD